MKILSNVYKEILDLPIVPPESGGIIGGRFDVISEFKIISSKNCECGDLYIPDVDKMNEIISEWYSEGIIDFVGIVHTHRPCSKELSPGDAEYIKRIMTSISNEKKELYFPIVIPQKEIIWYCAQHQSGNTNISRVTVEIES